MNVSTEREPTVCRAHASLYPRYRWRVVLAILCLLTVGIMTWRLLPGPKSGVALDLTDLTRSGYGPTGGDVNVILGLPDYFRLTNQSDFATQYRPDQNWVFLTTENVHYGALPDQFVPVLRVDDHMQIPAEQRLLSDSEHHRTSAILYPRVDASGKPVDLDLPHRVEIILPSVDAQGTRPILTWQLPITLSQPPSSAAGGSAAFPWVSLLALLGGLLASSGPCLFHLTSYFIFGLAGLSSEQAYAGAKGSTLRRSIIWTAILFILGVVVIYTLSGAILGLAAQSLRGMQLFEMVRRPIGIVAGSAIIFLALRMAVKGRAPFMCKMPLLSSHSPAAPARNWVRPLRTMGTGAAFATGCMSCVGAATIIGMITYVGTMGTPLSGSLIGFLFSLGISMPLAVVSLAMASALPMLGKLERRAAWIAFFSSAILVVFGVFMITGNDHLISNLLYRLAG